MAIKILDTLAKPKISSTSLVQISASQSFITGVFNKVIYGTVVSDESGCWVSGNNRFVVPYGVSHVRVTANFYWSANANGTRWGEIRKNGTTSYAGAARSQIRAASSGDTHHLANSAKIPVVQGDYFESYACQDTGSTINLLGDTEQTRYWNWLQIELFYS